MKDSGKTTVGGQVIDEYTSKGIPNATVVLEAENPNLYWGGSGTVAEYATDKYGNFSFSFDADADYEYQVNAIKKNLYAFTTNEPDINKGRKNKNLEVKLWPMTTVKFHLKDVESVDGSYLDIANMSCLDSKSTFQYPGLDETVYCHKRWNQEIELIWITRPHGTNLIKDTILHSEPLDTTAIDVYY